jgi:non-homologous end joining protein Ku
MAISLVKMMAADKTDLMDALKTSINASNKAKEPAVMG